MSIKLQTILSRTAFCIALVIRCSYSLVDNNTAKNQISIGARPSPLAQVQAKAVNDALLRAFDDPNAIQTKIHKIRAEGDHSGKAAGTQSLPLAVSSVDFTGCLDKALLSQEIDVAVHSMKDIPPTARWLGKGLLQIVCHLPREDPRDVLVGFYSSIANLPIGARLGTSSVRRQSQLMALRPDLKLVNLRGNVETRLGALKEGTVDALVLAKAGVDRLRQQSNSPLVLEAASRCHPISFDEVLPGACQGIVAAVCRADDTLTLECLSKINDVDANIAANAERAFLDTLDTFSPSNYKGSNSSWTGRPPLAAFMEKTKDVGWVFQGLLARPDGTKVIRERRAQKQKDVSMDDATTIGIESAEKIINEAGPHFYH